MHYIGWSIPTIFTLIPLSTNYYGQTPDENQIFNCSLGGDSYTANFWILFCYSGVSFIIFILMSYWTVEVYLYCLKQKEKLKDRNSVSNISLSAILEREISLFYSIRLYPITLILTWSLTIALNLCEVIADGYYDNSVALDQITSISATQYGTCIALIFFSQSPSARKTGLKILGFIFCYRFNFCCPNENFDDNMSSSGDNSNHSRFTEETDEDILMNKVRKLLLIQSIYN